MLQQKLQHNRPAILRCSPPGFCQHRGRHRTMRAQNLLHQGFAAHRRRLSRYQRTRPTLHLPPATRLRMAHRGALPPTGNPHLRPPRPHLRARRALELHHAPPRPLLRCRGTGRHPLHPQQLRQKQGITPPPHTNEKDRCPFAEQRPCIPINEKEGIFYLRRRRAASPANASKESVAVVGSGITAACNALPIAAASGELAPAVTNSG